MNRIIFSHLYAKMPHDLTMPTRLMEVFVADRKYLSEGFVEYDTRIDEVVRVGNLNCTTGIKTHYTLPDGKLLVLLLLTSTSIGPKLWTTIRKYTPEKERYYREMRGQEVRIEIDRKGRK